MSPSEIEVLQRVRSAIDELLANGNSSKNIKSKRPRRRNPIKDYANQVHSTGKWFKPTFLKNQKKNK